MEIQATTYSDMSFPAARDAASELVGTEHVGRTTGMEDAAETPPESVIVEISEEGRKTAQAAGSATEQIAAAKTANRSATNESLHDAQAFVYGALGMEHPDDTSRPKDSFYSAGKWLAAAATVGTIISLLV